MIAPVCGGSKERKCKKCCTAARLVAYNSGDNGFIVGVCDSCDLAWESWLVAVLLGFGEFD